MTWIYTRDGREMSRPGAQGIHIDGPLSSEDLRHVIDELLNKLVELTKQEAREAAMEEAEEFRTQTESR